MGNKPDSLKCDVWFSGFLSESQCPEEAVFHLTYGCVHEHIDHGNYCEKHSGSTGFYCSDCFEAGYSHIPTQIITIERFLDA